MLQESQFAQSKWVERGMQETLGKTNVSQHFSRRSKWKTFIGSLTHASRGGRHGHQGHPPQIQLQPLRNLWFFRQEYRGWPDMFAGKCLWGSIHTSPRGDRRPRRVRPQNLYVRAENARRLKDFQDCFKSVFPLNRIHKSTNKGYVTPAGYGPPETCIFARWWHLGV